MFTIYSSNSCGIATNCSYPNEIKIKNIKDLQIATHNDYVVAKYKGNYRSNDNFISSNCIAFDCDNDFSDIPSDWIDVPEIKEIFKNIKFAVHYSRNHNKEKNGKAPRPKFHIFFPVKKISTLKEYQKLKAKISELFPIFDDNALDGARFFFGTSENDVEIIDGNLTIDAFIKAFDKNNEIQQGSRNTAMSHFAGKVIKRFGDTDFAYKKFLEHSTKCNPPLEDEELNAIWRSAQKFFKKKILTDNTYVPVEEYEITYMPEDFTDVDQARLVAKFCGEKIVYTTSNGFLVYDGTRWIESEQEAIAIYYDFLDKQLKDADEYLKNISSKLMVNNTATLQQLKKTLNEDSLFLYQNAVAYKKFALKNRGSGCIKNVLNALKPLILKDINDFDKDEYILNTQHGTCNLRTGETKEHNHKDYLMKITSVGCDEKNKEIWLKAIDDFFCKDKDLISYVKQTVGLAAIGAIKQEAMIIAYGDGANGKSTFWNSIAKVLGNYSGVISSAALTVGANGNTKYEKAELKSQRLVIAAELEEGVRLSTSMVKQITSTDEITAEKKYQAPFKFTPTHTLVLYTNHLPKVRAIDNGTWRRLIVIPFKAKLKSDIKNYGDFLFKNCGGAILQWIIEGAMEVIKSDFNLIQPQVVVNSINKYKTDNNWFLKFVEECCDIDPSYVQKSGEFYQEYRSFCLRTGEYIRSTTDFYNTLEKYDYSRKRTKYGSIILGIKLKEEIQ